MPHYRWHLIGALFVFFLFFMIFLAVGLQLNPAIWAFSLVACLFSSLIPDIDSKKSKIYRITMDGIIVFGAVMIIFYTLQNIQVMLWLLLFWFLISGVLHIPFKHRGFIHSVWAAGVYSFLIGLLAIILTGSFIPGLFAFLGFFSHLALDRKV